MGVGVPFFATPEGLNITHSSPCAHKFDDPFLYPSHASNKKTNTLNLLESWMLKFQSVYLYCLVVIPTITAYYQLWVSIKIRNSVHSGAQQNSAKWEIRPFYVEI